MAKEQNEKQHVPMTQNQILNCLYDLCWLNMLTNSLANCKRKIKGIQSITYILRSDLNLIVTMLDETNLKKSAMDLWDAEEKLGYPTLKDRSAIMSKTTKDIFLPTKLRPKVLKLHKFKMQAIGLYENHRRSN